MEINLNADPEFRQMVRDELKAALISETKIEVANAVKEGIRRAVGTSESKIPDFIKEAVSQALPTYKVVADAQETIRQIVRAHLVEQIKEIADAEIKKFDVFEYLKKRISNLTIHFTC